MAHNIIDYLDLHLEHYPEEVQDKLTHYAEKWVNSYQGKALNDKTNQQILDLWQASEFIAIQSCHFSEAFIKHIQTNEKDYSIKALQKELLAISDEKQSIAKLKQLLRQFRNQCQLFIAIDDLLGRLAIKAILLAQSNLADVCIQKACETVYEHHVELHGTPTNMSGRSLKPIIIGLGKLGGRELNFSSDVDLIFAYAESGETKGVRRQIDNQQFFARMYQELIDVLHDKTEQGFVYRVDMRLRPNGESGPIAMSLPMMSVYLQSQGRDWERYAYIKARIIASDVHDREEFYALVQPFVYRRYIDFSVLDALRKMKRMVDQDTQKKKHKHHIKLGLGGIREIEFLVQSFQLVYGGRQTELQSQSIYELFSTFEHYSWFKPEELKQFVESYEWLRTLENRLQIFQDRQEHSLPSEKPIQDRIAAGYNKHWSEIFKRTQETCQWVHQTFKQFSLTENQSLLPENPMLEQLELIWLNTMDSEKARQSLHDIGLEQADLIFGQLQRLRLGTSYRQLSETAKERIDQLMPIVLMALARSEYNNEVLVRVVPIIEVICKRTAYAALLIENASALEQLIKLCALSQTLAKEIAKFPSLLDELINPIHLFASGQPQRLDEELAAMLANITADDEERQMDVLRQYKHNQYLRVAASELTGSLDPEEVSQWLSEIARVIMKAVVDIAIHKSSKKLNLSEKVVEDLAAGFAIVAYGKMGSEEIGYLSDLDIIFLYDEAKVQSNPVLQHDFYSRLAQKILHICHTQTPAGMLYEIDTRLRPSGQAGLLVSSTQAFERYQKESAWTWEHQALVRARVVVGEPVMQQQFSAVRHAILSTERKHKALAKDIVEMRNKMQASMPKSSHDPMNLKLMAGGINDIEFITQYFVLAYAEQYKELLASSRTICILSALRDNQLLKKTEVQHLSDAYQYYRMLLNHGFLKGELKEIINTDELDSHKSNVNQLWLKLFQDS